MIESRNFDCVQVPMRTQIGWFASFHVRLSLLSVAVCDWRRDRRHELKLVPHLPVHVRYQVLSIPGRNDVDVLDDSGREAGEQSLLNVRR
jgi:hypothetical protein